ncbi:MAG: cysteine--tRNA ligase [Candidatus Pacearchaeota archaeon]
MALKIYNTLARKTQEFKPINAGKVGMYSCGPTVYNYAHIGNLRTYVFNDLLKRSLTFLGYKVTHVMNITDVDDKTIKNSIKEGMDLKDFTTKYEKIFFEDLQEMNILKPTHILRATESIDEMVKLIKQLIKKGYAYKTTDGIYFSIDKFKDYGKLANLDKSRKTKERINSDEYDKENLRDFALWKFWTEEDGDVYWETEIGKGRPGWHIECSAMSMKILGNTLDIHTGASDLIFPHHTNEIAQSEAATGKKFVNYWVHGGFLTMKEGKMSKSLGNVYYLKDLKQKGFSPLEYRYMCLTTHYRSPLLFSIENLEAAKNAYQRLKNICENINDNKKADEKYIDEFKKALEDDLNIPKALQVLWELVRDTKSESKKSTIKEFDKVLGLDLLKKDVLIIPGNVQDLVSQRETARKTKNWKKADELRDKINKLGYVVNDTDKGPEIKKK